MQAPTRADTRQTALAKNNLSHLAVPGAELRVRVAPRASRNEVWLEEGVIRVLVTTVPEDGRANAAVVALLAKALGVAKSRLDLRRGAAARDKVFVLS